MDVAVSARPELCLQIQALTWGLKYQDLEKPEQSNTNPTAQKWKASDGSELQRVRRKVGKATIISEDKGEILWKSRTRFKPKPSPHAAYPPLTMEQMSKDNDMPEPEPRTSEQATILVWGSDTTGGANEYHVREEFDMIHGTSKLSLVASCY